MKRMWVAIAVLSIIAGPCRGQWVSCWGGECITSGNVGIGTGSPNAALHVAKTNNYAQIKVGDDEASSASGLSGIGFLSYIDGNNYIDSKTQPNGYTYFRTGQGPEFGYARYWMAVQAATGNVGIGTMNPQYFLAVNGTVQAKEVLVNTGWSDYVFDPKYRLTPLREVADFIRVNGHLPGIPSAKQVEADGVSLGEMQSKLLAKIEEITLHMIAAEDENRELREKVQRLDAILQTLQTTVPERRQPQ